MMVSVCGRMDPTRLQDSHWLAVGSLHTAVASDALKCGCCQSDVDLIRSATIPAEHPGGGRAPCTKAGRTCENQLTVVG
jgi:hypothetical protein